MHAYVFSHYCVLPHVVGEGKSKPEVKCQGLGEAGIIMTVSLPTLVLVYCHYCEYFVVYFQQLKEVNEKLLEVSYLMKEIEIEPYITVTIVGPC